MNLLDNTFGIHAKALQVRSQRIEVLAQNIANADTPSYKARDIDFKAVLGNAQSQQDLAMTATRSQHFSSGEPATDAGGLLYRVPFNTAFDGNTVEMSVEQAQYGKAAADYQATLQFLESDISGIRKALRGD
jgi:flagellar basal-body rod protein FlgB